MSPARNAEWGTWRRLLGVVLASGALAGCGDARGEPRARLSLAETLGGGDTAGYARAVDPRRFDFPADHGPHPEFRSEWWYVTGNVSSEDGREVGFQFTIFRSALAPDPPTLASAWATNQAYMAHLAVTDPANGTFRAFERFGRGALGLAGATAEPFRVWLEDWVLEGPGGDGALPMTLRAAQEDVALDLTFEAGKPIVLQGDSGLSRKGPEPGNASYYYSLTRMPASGSVVLGADTLRVRGSAWLDREWSTSVLSEGQVGWDWFALQLDNGWDLMVYQLRREDGTADILSEGVLVDPEGRSRRLGWDEGVRIETLDTWVSPLDGAVYPARWRVRVPSVGWDLEVVPVMAAQELDLAFRYWEGAVAAEGVAEGEPVRGRGYVELTGYAGARPDR